MLSKHKKIPQIHHHPESGRIMEYVAGRMDSGYGLAMALHLDACPQCRREADAMLAIAGEALEALPPADMDMTAAQLLQNAKAGEAAEQETISAIPEAVRAAMDGRPDGLKWQFLTPHLRQHILTTSGKSTARILWMKPGQAVPPHGHQGEEITMVLAGGYFDGQTAYTKGDIQWVNHSAPHTPAAMEDGPCFVLAVCDKPLKFKTLIPRLMQRYFKI